jgi:predicted naringenin-chalcone synthase
VQDRKLHDRLRVLPLLTAFRSTRPRYRLTQAQSLAWLAEAHVESEASKRRMDPAARAVFARRIASAIEKCACPPTKIATRGASIADVGSVAWDDHALYDLRAHPRGRGSAARTQLFAEIVDRYFATTYAEDIAPDDLIHVTCTGYISPSGAQQLVARRGWPTRVTHAYHMGCYAAMPAVRIAAGYLASATAPHRIDLVHTELCSLHLDPSDHRIEQLVVQSLFADGLIHYSMVGDDDRPGLRLRAVHEHVIPDSAGSMGWMAGDFGMQMSLDRDVPARVAAALRPFVAELFRRGGLEADRSRDCVFAVHPGGPRIIDGVRDVLELDEAQVQASRDVLFDHGNMSSATLPHIWMRLLDDITVPRGALIPSLAFGPGLTISGGLFEKQ